MNKRIEELADQCYNLPDAPEALYYRKFDHEKFAELIVKECAEFCDQAAEENARNFNTFIQTKEVESCLVTKGGQAQAEKLAKQIREHFGVE